MKTILRRAVAGLIAALTAITLAACGGGQAVAPLGRKPPPSVPATPAAVPKRAAATSHVVRRGESLYAIAWLYSLDYRDIAAWNRIAEPYTIYPGQQLQLLPQRRVPAPPRAPRKTPRPAAPPAKAPAKAPPPPVASGSSRAPIAGVKTPPAKRSAKTASYSGAIVKHWRWPARGKVIGTFNKSGGKGINIKGRRGQPVYTSAPGRVVYSGSGLRGYGKLVIIKHNKRFLSAYAHNQRLRVKEGDIVKSGQQIADMGDTESREIKLHFEIRRDGKPVNPSRYLPRSG